MNYGDASRIYCSVYRLIMLALCWCKSSSAAKHHLVYVSICFSLKLFFIVLNICDNNEEWSFYNLSIVLLKHSEIFFNGHLLYIISFFFTTNKFIKSDFFFMLFLIYRRIFVVECPLRDFILIL